MADLEQRQEQSREQSLGSRQLRVEELLAASVLEVASIVNPEREPIIKTTVEAQQAYFRDGPST